jgi:hypothetical protein
MGGIADCCHIIPSRQSQWNSVHSLPLLNFHLNFDLAGGTEWQ